MRLFIFMLLFNEILARIEYGKLKADNQKVKCNFKSYDNLYSEAFPDISAPHERGCGGDILSLQKIHTVIKASDYNLYGATNIVDLLYSRTGQFKINWDDDVQVNTVLNENICKNHFLELFAEFESSKSSHARMKNNKPLCLYNDIFEPSSENCPSLANNKIKKSEAAVFLAGDEAKVIQPGAGFCKNHWSTMMNLNDKNEANTNDDNAGQQGDSEVVDEPMDSEDETEKTDTTEEEVYKPDNKLDPELDKDVIDAVHKIGEHIGVQRIITDDSYTSLNDRSQRYKVVGGRSILQFFFGIMGPGAEEEFGAKVCSKFQLNKEPENKVVNNILEAVAEQYQRVPDKRIKQIILGPVAATCNYREILLHIPGLSFFLFSKARQCFNAEEIPKDLKRSFPRYDEKKITDFVEFFTSPHCMVLLPYGEKSIKLSNGEKLDIAANMRMQSHTQIIRMYRKKKEEEGCNKDDILPLSTMYAILELCHATKSKELTCVDYYLAAALDGFEVLEKTLGHWLTTEDVTVEESKLFAKELKMGQEYLETDFSMHLTQHTEVISHCINHALGDPTNRLFTNECEEHLSVCPRCELLLKTIDDFKKRIDKMVTRCKNEKCSSLEDLEIRQIQIDYAVFNILELRSHIIRAKISEMERAKDISELDETKAYITLDWAQKYIPTKYRETQKDYFGKDGMSYQVTHVQTVKDGVPFEYSFVHIIEQNKQDSTAVVSIILDVLKRLKARGISSTILRSDNAGCYHSKEVMFSLAEIEKQSAVRIQKYSFSEPQNGKGNCDRIAALVKNKVRRHIMEGNNVNDEKEFYNAMVSSPGMSYVTVILANVNRVTQKIKSNALQGIASFYVFTPQEDGIRVHRAANIGEGKLFKYNNLNSKLQKLPSLKISKEQSFEKIENQELWKSSNTRQKKNTEGEECHNFECPKADCDFRSPSYQEYMIHVVFEKHGRINSMRDFTATVYQQAVKQQKPNYNNIAQALTSERTTENTLTEENTPELGYAHKKPKKLPKITSKAEKFVKAKFDEGVASKANKWKPKHVVGAMMIAKDDEDKRLFSPNEILFVEQIQQLFSKFASAQKKSTTEPPKKKRKTCEERLTDLENEEEDLDECMDNDTKQNRHTNIVTRARRLQLENEIEQSFHAVAQAIVD